MLIGRTREQIELRISGATAIVQGFGNVGSVAALSSRDRGVGVFGVSDDSAALLDERGFDLDDLISH